MKKITPFFLKNCFIVLLLCVCVQNGQTQSSMTKKGSKLMIWSFGFSSTGGDLNGSETRSILSTNVRYLKFIVNNFALGLNLSMSRAGEKDRKSSVWSTGAEGAYFFNNEGNVKPFVAISLNWLNFISGDNNQGGFRGTPKAGFTINREDAVLIFEVGSDFDLIRSDTGYRIYTSVGVGYSF